MKKLFKLIPETDKLQHYFLGSLLFLVFSIFVGNLYALLINLLIAIGWEVWQKYKGGNNTSKETALDIAFSVLAGLLICIINF